MQGLRRKIAVGLLTVLLGTGGFFSAARAAGENSTNIELYARAAVLMDAESGRVLFDKNGDDQMPMASTTKIMTCIVALEYGNPDDYVPVSSYAAGMPKVKLYMKQGEYYKLEDLLYSLMLESHNDSAAAIAEHVAGSVEAFAAMMNQKARDIGCFDTYFITPNGLDAATADGTKVHSTTARDLAKIMSYCIKESPKKEEFLKITRTAAYGFTNYKQSADGQYLTGSRSLQCNNHNAFLNMMDGALSGKTGFTGNAGYCYVGALERDGRTYVVALLACGWPNNKGYKWSDTKELMSYGLENYFYRNVFVSPELNEPEVLEGIPAGGKPYGTAYAQIRLQTDGEEELLYLLREDEQVDVKVSVPADIPAPVEKGARIGSVSYSIDGTVIREYPITTVNGVEKISFGWITGYLFRLYCL